MNSIIPAIAQSLSALGAMREAEEWQQLRRQIYRRSANDSASTQFSFRSRLNVLRT